MTGPELAEALEALYGPEWRKKGRDALNVGRTTLYRQVMRPGPIERRYVATVKALLKLSRKPRVLVPNDPATAVRSET